MSLKIPYIIELEDLIIKSMDSLDTDFFDNDLTNTIHTHILKFSDFTIEEQKSIRSKINQENSSFLIFFSNKLALKAINSLKEKYLISAFLCHAIEDFKIDPRDNLRILSIINYCCEELDVDYNKISDIISPNTTAKASNYFMEFFSRKKQEKSLKAMGLIVTKTDKKINFENIRPR